MVVWEATWWCERVCAGVEGDVMVWEGMCCVLVWQGVCWCRRVCWCGRVCVGVGGCVLV